MILLSLTILFGQFSGSVYGEQAKVQTGEETQASSPVITIKSLLEGYGKEESWLDQQLASGYSLYLIHKALEAEKNGGVTAEAWLAQQKVDPPVIGDTEVTARTEESSNKEDKEPNAKNDAQDTGIKRSTALENSVDEAALKHVDLQDASSLYLNAYGEEAIATATGDVQISNVDMTLPGLIPFDLVRTYDSSRANEQIGVRFDEGSGTYQNESSVRKEELMSSLGRGWRWDLPFITNRAGSRQIYIPSVGTYNLSDSLKLEGYGWNDLTILTDTSITVDGISSAYRLSVLNGYDYFFSGEGNLLQIKDGYDNHVDFKYTTINGVSVLKEISNNEGNSIGFSYDSLTVTVQQKGTDRKIVYEKTPGEFTILSKVTDSLNRSTRYVYSIQNSRFNFLPGLSGDFEKQGVNRTALLVQMISPSSAALELNYETSLKKIGSSATEYVFKVRSRKNTYSTTSGEQILRNVTLAYSGEDLNSYGQSADWTTTVQDGRVKEVYNFSKSFGGDNQPELLRLKQNLQEGDGYSYKTSYTYDEKVNRNTPTQVEESKEQSGSASEKLVTTYAYDDTGLITSAKLSTGQEINYNYKTSAAPYHWKLPLWTEVKVNDTLRRITQYSYDPKGTETQVVVNNGWAGLLLAQTDRVVDSKGRIIKTTTKDETNDIQSSFTYESPYGSYLPSSRSIIVHDALSKTETVTDKFDYTSAGQLQTLTDGSGQKQTYEYDAGGRVTKILFKDGTQATTAYDDFNNRITRTAPDGIITKEQYNPFGLLAEEQTADSVYKYTYDNEGNITSSTDAENNITKYDTDAFGHLTQTNYADGTSSNVTYNVVERTTTYTDAAGNKIREKRDLLGRPLATEEWKNGAFTPLEKREYDLAGDVTAVIDGNGQRTQYTYDALGNISTVTTPDQRVFRYMYSKTGNLTSIMLPTNETVFKQHDELGRLIKETDSKRQTTTYFYDQRSNLVKLIDRQGRATEYTYSNDDMLTGIKGPDISVTYTYDDMGRRKSMTDEHGITSYNYSAANGMLQSLSYPDGTRIDYENNKQQRIGYSVTGSKDAALQVRSELDNMNRVIAMDVTVGSGGSGFRAAAASPLDRMTFDYGANSMLKGQSFGNGLRTGYEYNGYDLSGMQIQQNGKTQHQFGYTYDNNKNIISRTQNGVTDQYTYDPLNRIKSESGSQNETYSYNANGNRVDHGSGKIYGLKNAEYTYDSQNRLTQVQGEGKKVTYRYDGDGLLYERTEGDETTRYYYDDEAKLIAEANVSASGKPETTYIYVYDLNGELKSRLDKKTGKLQYYQLNGHGDVIGLVDADGNTLNSYTYDIWGGPLTEEETVPNVLRYSGEYWDNTTGLQYLRARWYDPGTARFMGEDTYKGELSDPLSLNLYTYVANNPLSYVDPSGYDPEFGSTAYGTYVHQQLGFIFKLVNYLGKEVAFTEQNVKLVNGKNGRLDYALQVSEHRFEIYELKPVSWMKEKNPELNASAHDQLNGYINGINMNGFRGDSKARAKVGTTWNPNGLVMMSPFNPKKEIVIYSNYALEPGMLYYGERNKQSKESVPEVDPKTVWDKIKDFFSAEYYPTDGVPGPHGLPSLGGGKKKSGGFIPFPPGLPVIPVL
ncbi:RHS repeat-associated core domain-containing protein [Paenibacillus sp. USDA918EY]|uniref:RHS repeat-associated core domain-containing protein n=1 Tax=Paenibacillus sp. USDA918EY TaxID=2689575 RepID=UPI00135C5273|nr:RHS repeat-associated core domain-containing protein [Paenibacillus sp. USDA918EY]